MAFDMAHGAVASASRAVCNGGGKATCKRRAGSGWYL